MSPISTILTIAFWEARRCLQGKRGMPFLALVALPILFFGLFLVVSLFMGQPFKGSTTEALSIYGILFQVFLLRSVLFLACVWVFMNLFRADLMDKSLHYFLLTPVRRWELLFGRFLAGTVVVLGGFLLSHSISFFLFHLGRDGGALTTLLTEHQGLLLLGSYNLMIILAVMGYGAICLILGLFFRNVMVSAALLYVWEWVHFLLPATLKKLSIIYYIKAFNPIPLPEKAFALVADPIAKPWAFLQMLLFVCLLLALASWRITRMELKYGKENG
jgi:hypothetical protein